MIQGGKAHRKAAGGRRIDGEFSDGIRLYMYCTGRRLITSHDTCTHASKSSEERENEREKRREGGGEEKRREGLRRTTTKVYVASRGGGAS